MVAPTRTSGEVRPARIDGYAPIKDYGAIGDGVTVALVGLDGSIDWLCLPRCDSEPIFAALLDPERGGRFALCPTSPFSVSRRYLPDSNVLETTFTTADGVVRVTDALTLQDGAELPWREVARRVEGLSGSVAMQWSVEPSELREARWGTDAETPVLSFDDHRFGLLAWDAGEPSTDARSWFRAEAGSRSLLALIATDGPLALPSRDEVEARLDGTAPAWRRWIRSHTYEGPWHDHVERSLLALKLLISSSTGAIVAAPTTSLPERIGGDRNWDYRYAWPRDSCFTMMALIRMGFREQAHASFTWLLDTLRGTHPEIRPIYRLDGKTLDGETESELAGYRGSRPVRIGNHAAAQFQLGGYGDLLDTACAYFEEGNVIDAETGRRLAEIADEICRSWHRADSGIWELDETRQFTQSKIACWSALERAIGLAEAGEIPDGRTGTWKKTTRAIVNFVEDRCWSEEERAYVQYPGSRALEAAQLQAVRRGYHDVNRERLCSTVDAIRSRLGRGPLLYRYSGMEDEEGAFVACSFWLVEALARLDRIDEAAELMNELVDRSNDLGLYSEEIDPATGDFLGNFPQGLSHLGLAMAATCIVDEAERLGRRID